MRNFLRILLYLTLGVLMLLGVDFILANLGIIDSIFVIPGVAGTHQVLSWFDAIVISLLGWIPIIGMLYWQRQKSKEGETAIEDLCEHLRRIGLDATIESQEYKKGIKPPAQVYEGWVMGSVRINNRNIDLIELWWQRWGSFGEYGSVENEYRCQYVVQAKVDGLEDKLKAESKPVMKGFFSRETVDFKWEGKELAQILNSDANLRKHFLSQVPTSFLHVEIIPHKEHKCIIRQKFGTNYVKNTFPTIETFEAYDRIAQHIRSIANVRP